jgi:hypothetical protein
MKKVVIRRCPEHAHIGARAREAESALRRVRGGVEGPNGHGSDLEGSEVAGWEL